MTAAIELSADGFLQQINEYECIRDLGVGATAEVRNGEQAKTKVPTKKLSYVMIKSQT